MSQVYVLANGETLGVFVGKDCGAGSFGLADDVDSAHVIQEAVVNATGVPGIYPLCASE